MSEISDETVNVFLRAAVAAGAGAYISGGQGRLEVNDDHVRAGLTAALVDGSEVDVRITPAVSRTFAAPVTYREGFHEPDEPVADVRAAFEAGEKGVTKPSAGAPQCTCPFIDVSSTPGKPEFVLGDPAGCEVHGQGRDAEIEAAKRRDAEIEAAKRRARAAAGYTEEQA